MNPRRLLNPLRLVCFIVCLAWLAGFSGCRSSGAGGDAGAGKALNSASVHSTEARTLAGEAKSNASAALPYTIEPGKSLLLSCIRQIADVVVAIDASHADAENARVSVTKLTAEKSVLQQEVAGYEKSLLGGRGRAIERRVKIAIGLIFLGGVVLQAIGLGVGGMIGGVLAFIGKVCASAVPFIGGVVHSFFEHLQLKSLRGEIEQLGAKLGGPIAPATAAAAST